MSFQVHVEGYGGPSVPTRNVAGVAVPELNTLDEANQWLIDFEFAFESEGKEPDFDIVLVEDDGTRYYPDAAIGWVQANMD